MKRTFVNQYNFHNCIQWNIDFVSAHAISAASTWPVVSVTKLFWWDVVDLRDRRSRWKSERDLIDQRNNVVAGWRNCNSINIQMRCYNIAEVLLRSFFFQLTQVAIVGVGSEHVFWPVEEESERKENFNVRSFLQQSLVNFSRVFQLVHADCVVSRGVTDGVQWVHYLKKTLK